MTDKVTLRERNALLQWQAVHGSRWRTALHAAWLKADYPCMYATEAAALQGLRNRLGPTWLNTYRLVRK